MDPKWRARDAAHTSTHTLQHTHCNTHTATHTLQHTHCRSTWRCWVEGADSDATRLSLLLTCAALSIRGIAACADGQVAILKSQLTIKVTM